MYQEATKTYQQANFITATPARLVILCYEGAIRNLRQAKNAYVSKDFETKALSLQKTLDIIHELNASLDMERGGKVAVNLRALYNFLSQTLVEADLKRDLDMMDKAIGILQELESAWKEVAGKAHTEAAPSMPLRIPVPGLNGASLGQARSA